MPTIAKKWTALFPAAATVIAALATGSVLQTSAMAATMIRVSQESAPGEGDFDDNVLGVIESFDSSKNIKATYNYNDSSFDGPIDLSYNTSHLFFVDAKDGLGLFSVHDKPNNGNGRKNAEMQFDLQGDIAEILKKDDPTGIDPDDQYTSSDTQFITKHDWGDCCTDGLAIGSLDGDWTMFAQFTSDPTGLDSWQAESASSTQPIELIIDPERRVRFDFFPEVSEEPSKTVPEPSSVLGLLAFGAVGITGLKRKKQHKAQNIASND